ncbi:CvpA family protein [Helicobacter cappadocius]|uniref:CvpA family protein n=1 Tax=Helicobacter cappadocius TaxID=3063998 RepID=A0AA90PR27_9HELI|nr:MULTISPECIES: CvpA family protein [unclassified Helicobacter]MDO7252719.1 CvpA family protein [Helicobacter sp. faydin-H75]MDP2538587.1 CvpA family protein [Helicobacter sp. faydin-H76]
MGYIDLILIIIIVVIGLRGFYNGFVNEVSGVLGIILGVFLGSRFATSMGEWITINVYDFRTPSIATLIGFVIILAVIWVAFLIVGVILSRFIKITDFSIIDKTLGFIFSCCKIFLIIGFILYGVSKPKFTQGFNAYLEKNSKIYPIMNAISATILKIPSVQETLGNTQSVGERIHKDGVKKLQETVNSTTQDLQDNITESTKEAIKKIPQKLTPDVGADKNNTQADF